jgi:hypothetical protein
MHDAEAGRGSLLYRSATDRPTRPGRQGARRVGRTLAEHATLGNKQRPSKSTRPLPRSHGPRSLARRDESDERDRRETTPSPAAASRASVFDTLNPHSPSAASVSSGPNG